MKGWTEQKGGLYKTNRMQADGKYGIINKFRMYSQSRILA